MNAASPPSLDDDLSSLLESMTAFRTSLTSPTVFPPPTLMATANSIITEAPIRNSRLVSQCVATTTSDQFLAALATDVCVGVDDTAEHAVASVASAATAYLTLKSERIVALEAIEAANARGDVVDAALERVRCAIASFDLTLADRDGEMASAAAEQASADRRRRSNTSTVAQRADTLYKALSQSVSQCSDN